MQHVWDRWLDTFSALVIYLSLVALGKDPGLWLALYNSKNLLFAKNDFFPPFTTEAWKQLAALGDPQVDELARKLQECCDPLWVCDRSLEAILEQPAAAPALAAGPGRPALVGERPASGPRLRAGRVAVPAVASPCPAARRRGGTPGALPGSAPARPAAAVRAARHGGHRTDAAAEPADGAAQRHHLVDPAGRPARPRVGQAGTRIPGIPRVRAVRAHAPGYAPHAPVPAPPGPPAPGPSAPATRTQTGPVVGALALALGILLLAIGAAGHVSIVVIGGLVAAAWGMWRLVTATGKGGKPPGPNSRG